MSCIHYKFKSSKDYDTLTFDGMHISLADLKKAILQNKKLTKSGSLDFDLQIVNAQTREVYNEAEELIPKNTSVVVARIPVGRPNKSRDMQMKRELPTPLLANNAPGLTDAPMTLERLKKTADLASAKASEEDKMKAMMDQSTRDYDSSNYVKSKYPAGRPLTGYVCHNCSKPGHFIQNCPVKKEEGLHRAKRSTGIPASFLTPVSDPTLPGALLLQTGQYAVPTLDAAAYKEGKKEKPPFVMDKMDASASIDDESAIPKELLCAICNDLLSDAVVIACCGNSFCDECIRGCLLDSETHTCPMCDKPNQSPDRLIPNRFLRTAVNNYLNETGYTKAKAFDKTPIATPDINSPAINSPNPHQSPAPPQESVTASMNQKYHDLPPGLVGLPPQVIRARQADIMGKPAPSVPASISNNVSASSSPVPREASPHRPLVENERPPGPDGDYGTPQAIFSTTMQPRPPLMNNFHVQDFNGPPRQPFYNRDRHHHGGSMGQNHFPPRDLPPLMGMGGPGFNGPPPSMPMSMQQGMMSGPPGLPDKVTAPLQLPSMNVPPPGFSVAPRGPPAPPGTVPIPSGSRGRDMRFGPQKPPLSRDEFYQIRDVIRKNKSYDPLEGAMEEFIRGSRRRPRSRSSSSLSGSRSRSRSPRLKRSPGLRGKSRSRSKGRRFTRSRSRSFGRSRPRSRSRTPVKKRKSWSRSPPPRRRSRSKSPVPLRATSFSPRRSSRSPAPRRSRSPFRKSPKRSPAFKKWSKSPPPPRRASADPASPRRISPAHARSPIPSKSPGKKLMTPPPTGSPRVEIAPRKRSMTPPPGTSSPPRKISRSPAKASSPGHHSPSPFKIRSPLSAMNKSPGRAAGLPKHRSKSPRRDHRGRSPHHRRSRSPFSQQSSWPQQQQSSYYPGYDYEKYRYAYPSAEPPADYHYPTDPYRDSKWAEYFNYYREWYDRMRNQGYPIASPSDAPRQHHRRSRSRSPPPRDRRSPGRSKKEYDAIWRDYMEREHREKGYDRRRDYFRDPRANDNPDRERDHRREPERSSRYRDEERRRPVEPTKEKVKPVKDSKKKKKKKDKKNKEEGKSSKKTKVTSEDESSATVHEASSPEKQERKRKTKPSPDEDEEKVEVKISARDKSHEKREPSPLPRESSTEKKVEKRQRETSLDDRREKSPLGKERKIVDVRRGKSPVGKDESPMRKNQSPEKRGRSPYLRSKSPTSMRKIKSPLRRELSPEVRNKSPLRRNKSPERRNKSPLRRNKSPLRRNRSPDRRNKSPERRNKSPERRDPSPERRNKSPERRNRSHERRDQSPVRRNKSPIEKREELSKKKSKRREADVDKQAKSHEPKLDKKKADKVARQPLLVEKRSPSPLYGDLPAPQVSSQPSPSPKPRSFSPGEKNGNHVVSETKSSPPSRMKSPDVVTQKRRSATPEGPWSRTFAPIEPLKPKEIKKIKDEMPKKKAISPIRVTPDRNKKEIEKKKFKEAKPKLLKRPKPAETVNEKPDEHNIFIQPPELSKWERDRSSSEDEDEMIAAASKRRKIEPPKSSLPKSVIESAENLLANKPRKGAVVSSAIMRSPPPSTKSSSRYQKQSSSSGRKVFVERSPSPVHVEKDKPRKVTKDVGSFQVTVTAKEHKRKNSQPFDLRDKLKGHNEQPVVDKRNVLTADKSHKPIIDRKISVMEEDIFEPDYDEDVEQPLTKSALGKKQLSRKHSDSGSDSSHNLGAKIRERISSSTSEKKHKNKKDKKDKDKKKKVKKEKKKHKKHKNKDKDI